MEGGQRQARCREARIATIVDYYCGSEREQKPR
jgi:hypothetical protein